MRAFVIARILMALAVAAGAISVMGFVLLIWTEAALPGKELALGVMAVFWFGGWVLVEVVLGLVAFWWLRREGIPGALSVRSLYAATWVSVLLLAQYLGFKWAWGNDGYTELARRIFLPAHTVMAVLLLVGGRWRRGPSLLTAAWLVFQALGDALTSPGGSPLGGWCGLAVGGILLLMMVRRPSVQSASA